MSNTEKRDEAGLQSVDRAISVLQILSRRREAGVSEVADELAVHKSTASRLLGALQGRGLVEQIGHRGKYRLGVGLLPLVGAVTDRLDVIRQAHPVCERLATQVGETVNVGVRQDQWAVNVHQVRGPSTVSTHNWVGQLTPLHCTSNGKVLLAFSTDLADLADVALPPLHRFTDRTITGAELLRDELATVRTTGVGRAVEEYEEGLNAVAAPIYDVFGAVTAALSLSGPSYRFTPRRVDEAVPALERAAVEISRRMGFRGA